MGTISRSSLLDGIGPAAGTRRPEMPSGRMMRASTLFLLSAAGALVVAGPSVMSRTQYTALELLALGAQSAFGIFLAARMRSTQVTLDRAYSSHLEELSQRLRNMAYRDALTGLYNHRYFYEQLSHEIERSTRYGQSLSILLMDMNNFKDINDTYGHMVGDKFLSLVGQVISQQIRSSDIGARYGGDEFVVILPNTGIDEARATAEKLAAAIASAARLGAIDSHVQLGISIGVASCPDDSRAAGSLLEIADSRLYAVKSARPDRRARRQQEPA